MKRQRGRGRKPSQNSNRSFESTGPDIKIRGSAQHVCEKYQQLARDAMSSGDRVMAENYLQHAEHYYRILMASMPQGLSVQRADGTDSRRFSNSDPDRSDDGSDDEDGSEGDNSDDDEFAGLGNATEDRFGVSNHAMNRQPDRAQNEAQVYSHSGGRERRPEYRGDNSGRRDDNRRDNNRRDDHRRDDRQRQDRNRDPRARDGRDGNGQQPREERFRSDRGPNDRPMVDRNSAERPNNGRANNRSDNRPDSRSDNRTDNRSGQDRAPQPARERGPRPPELIGGDGLERTLGRSVPRSPERSRDEIDEPFGAATANHNHGDQPLVDFRADNAEPTQTRRSGRNRSRFRPNARREDGSAGGDGNASTSSADSQAREARPDRGAEGSFTSDN